MINTVDTVAVHAVPPPRGRRSPLTNRTGRCGQARRTGYGLIALLILVATVVGMGPSAAAAAPLEPGVKRAERLCERQNGLFSVQPFNSEQYRCHKGSGFTQEELAEQVEVCFSRPLDGSPTTFIFDGVSHTFACAFTIET